MTWTEESPKAWSEGSRGCPGRHRVSCRFAKIPPVPSRACDRGATAGLFVSGNILFGRLLGGPVVNAGHVDGPATKCSRQARCARTGWLALLGDGQCIATARRQRSAMRGFDAPESWPCTGNPGRVESGLLHWKDAVHRLDPGPDRDFAEAFPGTPSGKAVLATIFGASPFLGRCAVRDPGYVRALWERGPDRCVADAIERVQALPLDAGPSSAANALRLAARVRQPMRCGWHAGGWRSR